MTAIGITIVYVLIGVGIGRWQLADFDRDPKAKETFDKAPIPIDGTGVRKVLFWFTVLTWPLALPFQIKHWLTRRRGWTQ
jgi:hypothetical protein